MSKSKVCEQIFRYMREMEELQKSRYGKRVQKLAVSTMFLYAKFYRHFAAALPSKAELEEMARLNISRRIVAVVKAAEKAFWETEIKDLPEVPGKVVDTVNSVTRKAQKTLSHLAEQFEERAAELRAKQNKE